VSAAVSVAPGAAEKIDEPPNTNSETKPSAKKAGGIRVAVDIPDGTPAFYANYLEIGHTKWDFCLIVARLPAKPNSAKLAEIQSTGVISWPAELTINFPPAVIPGLIRALTIQKEKYEKENNTELKDTRDK
jgi:hypothetical protein